MDSACTAEGSTQGADASRVLIVQPNRSYLAVLARRITEGGYRVSTAECTQSALAELHRVKVDLSLSERRMSQSGGVELVRMVRDDPGHRVIPIFLLTGKSDGDVAV